MTSRLYRTPTTPLIPKCNFFRRSAGLALKPRLWPSALRFPWIPAPQRYSVALTCQFSSDAGAGFVASVPAGACWSGVGVSASDTAGPLFHDGNGLGV